MSENILKKRKKSIFFRTFCLSLGLAAFCSTGSVFAHTAAQNVSLQNISDLSASLVRYHDDGQYQRDFDRVANQAIKYLKKEADPSEHQAIVLDIDETTLSQWPELKANQFAYFKDGSSCHLPKGPCSERGWVRKEAAIAFPSTRTLIEEAQKRNIAVFFVTGRSVKYRHHMIRNLHKEQISGWTGLYMRSVGDKRSAIDYKTPIREKIEGQGYRILLNMGDQKTDLIGGHGGKTFLLPNPFYRVR